MSSTLTNLLVDCAGRIPASTEKALAVIAVLLGATTQGWANVGESISQDGFDQLPAVPKELEGIDIVERIGAKVPAELTLIDETGNPVEIRALLDTQLPTLLTFNYSDCPMLCNLQLSALVRVLKRLPLVSGKHFRIVTVGIDPNETTQVAAQTKKQYLSRLDKERAEALREHWHFLNGSETNVRALASTVGFGYRYLPERREYAHSTALILLSPSGEVTSYLKGIHYEPADLTAAILEAGMSKKGTSLGFALSCFRYDSDANNYSGFASNVMRWGGIAFVVTILLGMWFASRFRRGANMVCDRSRPSSMKEFAKG